MNAPTLQDVTDDSDAMRYLGDGLGDLFLGLVLVEGAVVMGDATAPLAGLFVILVPLLFLAKRRYVAPRLSHSDLAVRPRWTPMVRGLAWGGSATGLLASAALVLRFAVPTARPWGLLCIAGAAIVAQIGLRTATGRLVLYAVVVALLAAGHVVWGLPQLAALLGISGVAMAVTGGVLFVRFLLHHRPAAETHS